METLAFLGRTLGFSFAAGINLYATVALIGLASRFGWVVLPGEYAMFDHDWVIGTAIVLYVVEFIADKVPWVDTLWDSVHTFIRPVGGALVAVAGLGEASPATQGMIALLGGAVAAGATSPRPARAWWPTPAPSRFRTGCSACSRTRWSSRCGRWRSSTRWLPWRSPCCSGWPS